MWLASTNNGRPQVSYKGRMYPVTRLIMHLKHGFDLGSDEQILHKPECELKIDCINDEHFYIGSNFDNMLDKSNDITHCPHGHSYSKENTGFQGGGKRYCITCRRERVKKYQEKRRFG